MFLYVGPVVKLLKMMWAYNIFYKRNADQHIQNVHILCQSVPYSSGHSQPGMSHQHESDMEQLLNYKY